MLSADGLTKRYGDRVALDGVGLEVARGEMVGFLGPNGAGKTTTMRAIMQLVALDAGRVTWDGGPVDAEVRRRFGYMPAERGMYPRMRVGDHLTYYGRLSGRSATEAEEATDRWLARLGLAERRDDTVQSLSSGNQQRVQLALALLDEPDLLILDEPFAGLDPVAVEMLGQVLREEADRGAALLLSSHQLDLVADVCRSVVIVDRGRVVLRGEVDALRAASPVRHLDVEYLQPTEWQPGRGDVSTLDDGRRHRVEVPPGDEGGDLLAEAHRAGEVVAYSLSPPDLSEVFLDAVGRDTVEDPDHQPVGSPA